MLSDFRVHLFSLLIFHCTDIKKCIYLPVNKHMSYFQFGVVANKASMNIIYVGHYYIYKYIYVFM